MKVTVNDLSFMFPFYDETRFWNAVKQFVQICRELESDHCHNVDGIASAEIDKNIKIYPHGSLYKAVQRIEDRDERKYFLSLLTNREQLVKSTSYESAFIYKGKCSFVCPSAKSTALVSLESENGFAKAEIVGEILEEKVPIRNVSCEKHLYLHRDLLGLRIYKANETKHKKDRCNPYGKGKTGSPMDLTEDAAQQLLDQAIWIKNRLYARKGNTNYAFQNTNDCIYHGYIADDLGDDILAILHTKKWD